MTPRQQFKFAMLRQLAAHGIAPAEMPAYVKAARESVVFHKRATLGDELTKKLINLPGTLLDYGTGGLSRLGTFTQDAGALGLFGAGAAGIGLGHLAAKATEPDIDPEHIKRYELMAAYKQYAAQVEHEAEMRRAAKQLEKAPPRSHFH